MSYSFGEMEIHVSLNPIHSGTLNIVLNCDCLFLFQTRNLRTV